MSGVLFFSKGACMKNTFLSFLLFSSSIFSFPEIPIKLHIPCKIEPEAICSHGEYEEGQLVFDVTQLEAVHVRKFKAVILERHKERMPFVFAIVETESVRYGKQLYYHCFDAASIEQCEFDPLNCETIKSTQYAVYDPVDGICRALNMRKKADEGVVKKYLKACKRDQCKQNLHEFLGLWYRDKNLITSAYYFDIAAPHDANAVKELYEIGCEFMHAKQYQEGIDCFFRAASHGNSEAQTSLGFCYAQGKVVEKNYVIAATFFIEAYKRGSMDACHNLGYLYRHGYGVTKSIPTAAWCFKKCSDIGEPQSMYELGLLFQEDEGNNRLARRYLRQAAQKGHKEAQQYLADHHSQQLCIIC